MNEAEAVSICDFMQAVKRNTKKMNRGMIIMNNNNSKLMRVLGGRIEKASQFAQEAMATITEIKKKCK